MTDKQRAHIEKRLLEERDRAMDALRDLQQDTRLGETESSGDLSQIPQHLADRGTDAQEREMDLTLMTRQRERIEQIDAALRLLRDEPEKFGRSEVSGEEIPFERLDLIPWARRLESEEPV